MTFTALSETFVVGVLTGEGVPDVRARLAARLAGGNLGRARRLAVAEDGLAFRDAAREAVIHAAEGPPGALDAAGVVLDAAAVYKKNLKAELDEELAPFYDARLARGRLSGRDQADPDPVPTPGAAGRA